VPARFTAAEVIPTTVSAAGVILGAVAEVEPGVAVADRVTVIRPIRVIPHRLQPGVPLPERKLTFSVPRSRGFGKSWMRSVPGSNSWKKNPSRRRSKAG
jgi:hypothetical protein